MALGSLAFLCTSVWVRETGNRDTDLRFLMKSALVKDQDISNIYIETQRNRRVDGG